MEAPNKIFAGYQYENNDKELYARKVRLTYRDTEYIRKDALVEWIQTELKSCEGAAAMTRAYHKLIDKISLL